MKPSDVFKRPIPVNRALIGASLQKIHTHTPRTAHNVGVIHPKAAQLANEGVCHWICSRKHRDEPRRQPKVGQRHHNISLASTKACQEMRRLQDTLRIRRSETKHHLSKSCNEICHHGNCSPALCFCPLLLSGQRFSVAWLYRTSEIRVGTFGASTASIPAAASMAGKPSILSTVKMASGVAVVLRTAAAA